MLRCGAISKIMMSGVLGHANCSMLRPSMDTAARYFLCKHAHGNISKVSSARADLQLLRSGPIRINTASRMWNEPSRANRCQLASPPIRCPARPMVETLQTCGSAFLRRKLISMWSRPPKCKKTADGFQTTCKQAQIWLKYFSRITSR